MTRKSINNQHRRGLHRDLLKRKATAAALSRSNEAGLSVQNPFAPGHASRGQALIGVYNFGLPALSSCPKGAYQINRGLGNARFAVEMAMWTGEGRIYLGMFDPSK